MGIKDDKDDGVKYGPKLDILSWFPVEETTNSQGVKKYDVWSAVATSQSEAFFISLNIQGFS